MGWRLVEGVRDLEELMLVLVPKESGWRNRNKEVEFIDAADDVVIREERAEMSMWRKVHETEVAKLRESTRRWKEPFVRFVVARKT
jgi:hypothetical protein